MNMTTTFYFTQTRSIVIGVSLGLAVCSVGNAQTTEALAPSKSVAVTIVNPEDLLDHSKTILVPTTIVTVMSEGKVGAVRQSGLFQRGNATANANITFKVLGLEKAFLQELAQKAQDDLVAKLQGAGYKVLTYVDIKDRDFVKAAEREKFDNSFGLPVTSEGGVSYLNAAPSDEQYFKSGLGGGFFSSFLQYGKSLIPDATVIIPHYVIQAPQIWGETSRGLSSVSAEIKKMPGMNLSRASAYWLGAPKSRMMRGIPGVATKQQISDIAQNVGTLSQTADNTPQTANVLSSALSMLSGAGNVQRSSQDYAFQIDREAYLKGALNGIAAFNSEVAKSATEVKP
jgi:hypothetical protein